MSLGPCKSSQQLEIDVISRITFTVPFNFEPLCVSNAGQLLEVGASGGTGNYAYTWNPSNYLSSPTGDKVICKALGTTIYNVTAIDVACPNNPITQPYTVFIKPRVPHDMLKLDKLEGCQPLNVFFDSNTNPDSVLITYDFGGIKTFQGDSLTITLKDPGTYNFEVRYQPVNVGKYCPDSVQFDAPIVVFPKSNTDIIWSPEVPTSTENLVTFSPISKYGPVTSYSWSFWYGCY